MANKLTWLGVKADVTVTTAALKLAKAAGLVHPSRFMLWPSGAWTGVHWPFVDAELLSAVAAFLSKETHAPVVTFYVSDGVSSAKIFDGDKIVWGVDRHNAADGSARILGDATRASQLLAASPSLFVEGDESDEWDHLEFALGLGLEYGSRKEKAVSLEGSDTGGVEFRERRPVRFEVGRNYWDRMRQRIVQCIAPEADDQARVRNPAGEEEVRSGSDVRELMTIAEVQEVMRLVDSPPRTTLDRKARRKRASELREDPWPSPFEIARLVGQLRALSLAGALTDPVEEEHLANFARRLAPELAAVMGTTEEQSFNRLVGNAAS